MPLRDAAVIDSDIRKGVMQRSFLPSHVLSYSSFTSPCSYFSLSPLFRLCFTSLLLSLICYHFLYSYSLIYYSVIFHPIFYLILISFLAIFILCLFSVVYFFLFIFFSSSLRTLSLILHTSLPFCSIDSPLPMPQISSFISISLHHSISVSSLYSPFPPHILFSLLSFTLSLPSCSSSSPITLASPFSPPFLFNPHLSLTF